MTLLRRILAFIVAPLVVTGLIVAFAMIDGAGDARFTAMVVFAITLAHSLFLGVPIAIAMSRLGKLTFRNTAVASFLIGALPLPTLLFIESWPTSFTSGTLPTAGIFGMAGLVGGLVWWPMWRAPSVR